MSTNSRTLGSLNSWERHNSSGPVTHEDIVRFRMMTEADRIELLGSLRRRAEIGNLPDLAPMGVASLALLAALGGSISRFAPGVQALMWLSALAVIVFGLSFMTRMHNNSAGQRARADIYTEYLHSPLGHPSADSSKIIEQALLPDRPENGTSKRRALIFRLVMLATALAAVAAVGATLFTFAMDSGLEMGLLGTSALGALLVASSAFPDLATHLFKDFNPEQADKHTEARLALVIIGGIMLAVSPSVQYVSALF